MKKILLSAIVMMAFGVAQGQTRFGVKLGSNIATITGDAEGVAPKLGLHIGGLVEFKFTEKFAMQPELLYSMQGATSSDSGDFTLDLNYLTVPVMFKYYIIEGLSAEAGPQFGLLVSADNGDGEDATLYYEDIDLGLSLGAGYELPFGLFFQARYYIGMYGIGLEEDQKINNSVLQFSVGYKF